MYKLAIPISEGRLSSYFNHCQHLSLVDIDDNSVVCGHTTIPCIGEHQAEQLIQLGVTDLLVYKIDLDTLKAFEHKKINVFVGVECLKLEVLINDFMEGKITSNEKIIGDILSSK